MMTLARASDSHPQRPRWYIVTSGRDGSTARRVPFAKTNIASGERLLPVKVAGNGPIPQGAHRVGRLAARIHPENEQLE
jgi:hypothetical protein